MFGHDPELPDGFQDADFEMRALEEEGNRLHREEKKKKTLPPVYEEGQHDNTGIKEPTFGTKDFGNGAWGQLKNPERKKLVTAWNLLSTGIWPLVNNTDDEAFRQAFWIIDNAIGKGGD